MKLILAVAIAGTMTAAFFCVSTPKPPLTFKPKPRYSSSGNSLHKLCCSRA